MAKKKKDEEIPVVFSDPFGTVTAAVFAFADTWMPAPRFDAHTEIMSIAQLRDAMGLRVTPDYGDPWPFAEKTLLSLGFEWHWLSGQRFMFLRAKDEFSVQSRPDAQNDAAWQDVDDWDE